jgi:SAM-dependent methyltransferase
MAPDPDRLESTRRLWSLGDYARMGDVFAQAGADLVERVGVAGLDVLDVATGTGNTALAAFRAGASRVVGVDATASLLAEAARRGGAGAANVEWQEGDMEALPFADAGFYRVVSSFGAMFATDQRATAAELVRVCRPGGRVGLTAWALGGLFDRTTTLLVDLMPSPPPPGPSPRDWAWRGELERIFAGLPVEMAFEERSVAARFSSPSAAVALVESAAAPIIAVRQLLVEAGRWDEAHAGLEALFEDAAVDEDDGCRLDLGYTLAVLDVAA